MKQKQHKGYHTTKQKGGNSRRTRGGVGTYSQLGKSKNADRYDRPYLDGSYRKWETWAD